MAEVGLVPFARLALKIATTVLPRYRTRFSKHQFTQPQLLAILCLMRYEDWTFREAEVRLNEHRELRRALGLHQVPDHSTMCRFLLRLPEESIGRALAEAARRFPRRRRRARVAIDGTGLSSGAVSTFFVRRMHHHGKKPLPWPLAEVAGGRGSRRTTAVVPDGAAGSVERLCQPAPLDGCGPPRGADPVGVGRCRVRQREKSYLCSPAAQGAQRDSRQAGEENLAGARRTRANAPSCSATPVSTTGAGRERFLRG